RVLRVEVLGAHLDVRALELLGDGGERGEGRRHHDLDPPGEILRALGHSARELEPARAASVQFPVSGNQVLSFHDAPTRKASSPASGRPSMNSRLARSPLET